jgi:hypothetical protein
MAAVDHLLAASPAARFTAAVLDASSRSAAEMASLRSEHASVTQARIVAEAYAADLRVALTRTEEAAARHFASLEGVVAARDAEIAVLKALGAHGG